MNKELPVDLRPSFKDQLQVFMQIETPEFPPVELALRVAAPATIGAFYDTISNAFDAVNPVIDQNAHFVAQGAEVFQIKSIADAHNALNRSKSECEGGPGSPDHPANPSELADFYGVT